MQDLTKLYRIPPELVLGSEIVARLPKSEQDRQRRELEEILKRFRKQPGVVLADEVGMGKTFVALAVAYSIAIHSPKGPVIVMAPGNLLDKWERDLKTFTELYLKDRTPVDRKDPKGVSLRGPGVIRYALARHSIDLLRLLDDSPSERCHVIFLSQGSMARSQTDRWVRLALISEALRKHGRGGASKLIKVKRNIHRFLGELLNAVGEQRAHGLRDELWERLMRTDPSVWKKIYNEDATDHRQMVDDPVPKAIARRLRDLDLKDLANALQSMPIRATGGDSRVTERLKEARSVLKQVEARLWREILAKATWRSPLLIMDEAHHLKNPQTSLARQLQSPDLDADLKTGDGAMARTFDRMLFLTATPFQLGHHELIRVMRRFGDVRWSEAELGPVSEFKDNLDQLGERLTEFQRAAIGFQKAWSRLKPEDCGADVAAWWASVSVMAPDTLAHRERAVFDAFHMAKGCSERAQKCLRGWIIRHNKPDHWSGTAIPRRSRVTGAGILGGAIDAGLPIPPQQLLPFFLAARSAINPHKDLLGDALSSSFEAFRYTRQNRRSGREDQEESETASETMSHAKWYLSEFDSALASVSGSVHPKIHATVCKTVDLWEAGEKVLVFAFYQQTCRALRIHISGEIEKRMLSSALARLKGETPESLEKIIGRVQDRFFDSIESPGRRAIDSALEEILGEHRDILEGTADGASVVLDVMRRFLRVRTTLIRSFPLAEFDSRPPEASVSAMLSHADGSGLSWRDKLKHFVRFLVVDCSVEERRVYLDAASGINTGEIYVQGAEEDERSHRVSTLANVQVAMGATNRDTRSRLMMAFNTPFFPDILVCSEVMGEGVDLQRYCRHVIHHDLAWNPSEIEQRTGRIDRIACKAEGTHPINVYLPYIGGSADERQFRVMSDRERWFRVVMGQDEVARLVSSDSEGVLPLTDSITAALSFRLAVHFPLCANSG